MALGSLSLPRSSSECQPIRLSSSDPGPNSPSGNKIAKAKNIPPPCGLWPSNGPKALEAGGTVSRMTRHLSQQSPTSRLTAGLKTLHPACQSRLTFPVSNLNHKICQTTSDVWLGL